jgi:hypothetical protein
MDPYSAAEQRGIIPSAFGGIVRLTNFSSLRSKNLSLTNKYVNDVKLFNSYVTFIRLKLRNLALSKFTIYMKAKISNTKQNGLLEDNIERNDPKGYPLYPANEDIYSKHKIEGDINPEDISKTKEPVIKEKIVKDYEPEIDDDESGSDLDVPGSELDDEQENIGNEDEENNYYSLGGDDHNDLDEDRGE